MIIAPATLALVAAVLWIAAVVATVILIGLVIVAIGAAVCVGLAVWAFLTLIERGFRCLSRD